MYDTALRPRSITEIVDAAFHLLRERYVAFVTAGAVVLSPVILLHALLPSGDAAFARLLANFLYGLFDAAVIVLVSDAYLGRPADVPGALREVAARAGRLFGASFLRGVLVLLAALLFVIPGLIVLALTFAAPMVVMLEDPDDATMALRRSRELVRGDLLRVTGTVVLAFVVLLVLVIVASVPLGLLEGVLGSGPRVLGVTNELVVLLVYPLVSVVGTLLYYDLRIRKEGFDLEMMARELGVEGARSAPVV